MAEPPASRADIRDVHPFERNARALARAARLTALAVLLAAAPVVASGCAVTGDPPEEPPAAPAAAAPRAELPDVPPGIPLAELAGRLESWPPGHRFTLDGVAPEGWEWSGPDGMRVEVYVAGGGVVASRVSRTWGSGAPPVEGRELPGIARGVTAAKLFTRIGPGLLVERARTGGGGWPGTPRRLERYRWAIHDRGLDTGLFLVADVREDTVAAVSHPWSRR